MDAIKYMKKDDASEPPKLYKTLAIEEYLKSLDVYCASKIGAMMCPLDWFIRENATVPANAPAMEPIQPYSTEHGLVMEEMAQRYSHGHTLFATDSSAIYDLLDVAMSGTKYHTTIAPYKRGSRKYGRGAYISMNAKFCGPALWDKIFRDNMNTLILRTWNGNSGIDLEKYLTMHCHAWIQCQRCADHIQCVIKDER